LVLIAKRDEPIGLCCNYDSDVVQNLNRPYEARNIRILPDTPGLRSVTSMAGCSVTAVTVRVIEIQIERNSD